MVDRPSFTFTRTSLGMQISATTPLMRLSWTLDSNSRSPLNICKTMAMAILWACSQSQRFIRRPLIIWYWTKVVLRKAQTLLRHAATITITDTGWITSCMRLLKIATVSMSRAAVKGRMSMMMGMSCQMTTADMRSINPRSWERAGLNRDSSRSIQMTCNCTITYASNLMADYLNYVKIILTYISKSTSTVSIEII